MQKCQIIFGEESFPSNHTKPVYIWEPETRLLLDGCPQIHNYKAIYYDNKKYKQ